MDEIDGIALPPEGAGLSGRRADTIAIVPQGNAALLQMAEHTGDLIALCDANGELTYLNPAGRRLIGIADADIFPMRLSEYVVPQQRWRVDAEIVPTARSQGVWEGEMQLVNLQDDRIIDVLRSTFATRDEQGTVTGFVSVMRDITHTRAEQARLRQQLETVEALIANAPFGVCLIDAAFTVRLVSRAAAEMFASIPSLIGRDLADSLRTIWPEPLASEAIGRFRRTLETGVADQAPATLDHHHIPSDQRAYQWRIERLTLPDEQPGIVWYFDDITERERHVRDLAVSEARLRDLAASLDQQIRARTSALHRANDRLSVEIERREALQATQFQGQKLEAIGQLTSGIAHDFNNILGAVIGGFTVIGHHTEDSRVRQIATIGQRAAERGAALIRQLMAFTRMQDVVPQSVDVASAVAEASTLISHGVDNSLEVSVACGDDIWPVFADVAQLQSALLNLANNASDAMRGRGTLRITVCNRSASSPDHPLELAGRDAVLIDVADNGPGMDSGTLQRITEPFFTTKGPGKGTGLGLAMVQRFVEQARGAIRIESRLGQGSTFSIFLPRALGHTEQASSDVQGDGDPGVGRAFETVLLVDDDPELTTILAEALGDAGFDVLTAPDGETALNLVRTRGIDALVADVDMPGMNGIALVARVRTLLPEMPCLFMTGMTEPGDLAGETVIQKPFTPATLHYALRRRLAVRTGAASDADRTERLGMRLKSDCTKALFDHWNDIRHGTRVPSIEAFDIGKCSEPHRIVIVEIDLGRVPIHFSFTVMDDTLRRAASGDASGGALPVSGDDSFGAQEAAYRRCAITGRPSYEYARIDLGDERLETFERLLLPFSTRDGVVDRIVGAVVIEESVREASNAARQ